MTEIATGIAGIYSSAKAASDIIKHLIEVKDSLQTAESKIQLTEILSSMAHIQLESAELKNALVEKENEILRLRKDLEIKQNFKFFNRFVWNYEADKREGPYCPLCFEKDKLTIHLIESDNPLGYVCLSCNHGYDKP